MATALGFGTACADEPRVSSPEPSDVVARSGEPSLEPETGEGSAGDEPPAPSGDEGVDHANQCQIDSTEHVLLTVPSVADAATDVAFGTGAVLAHIENVTDRPVRVELWAQYSVAGTLGKSDAVVSVLEAGQEANVEVPVFADPAAALDDLEYPASIKIVGHLYLDDRYIGGVLHVGLWAYDHPSSGPIVFNDQVLAQQHNAGDLLGKHSPGDLSTGSIARAVKLEPDKFYGDPTDPKPGQEE